MGPTQPNAASLSRMLDNLTDQRSILDIALNLFWKGTLLGIVISPLLGREHDIDSRAFASKDLSTETLLSQVDSSAINLIQKESGREAVDLEGELLALNDIKAADKRIDDDGQTVTVVDGDSVGLVRNLDDSLVAATDKNGLVLLRGDIDHVARLVVVLDQPFVTFQFLARRLAGAHALGFWFFARRWGLASHRAVAVWCRRACAQARVLVRHLGFVDLAEVGGNRFALIELVKDCGHVWCTRPWWRRRRWRCPARDVQRWNWGRRRWRRNGTPGRCRPSFDLLQGVESINTRPVVPGEALGIVLLDIGREGLEVLIVRLDVVDMCSVPSK